MGRINMEIVARAGHKRMVRFILLVLDGLEAYMSVPGKALFADLLERERMEVSWSSFNLHWNPHYQKLCNLEQIPSLQQYSDVALIYGASAITAARFSPDLLVTMLQYATRAQVVARTGNLQGSSTESLQVVRIFEENFSSVFFH